MALYAFEAKSLDGKIIKGQLRAESEGEVYHKLRGQFLIPIDVSVTISKKFQKKGVGIFFRVKKKEINLFTRQMSTLIGSGVPITQSLEVMLTPGFSVIFREMISIILVNIRSGHSFSASLSVFTRIFGPMYVNVIAAGEESGDLSHTLDILGKYMEKIDKLRSKVIRSMWYPAFIVAFLVLIVIALLLFVLPSVLGAILDMNQTLPYLTVIVVWISDLLLSYWYLWILIPLGVGTLFIWIKRTKTGREFIDHVVIRIPLFGSIIQEGAIAKACRTLSILVASHVRITEALLRSASVTGNIVIETYFLDAREKVMRGSSLATSLGASDLPPLVCSMIAVGEETGRLDYILEKLAFFYEEEVDRKISVLFTLIEPTLIIIIGLIISVFVVAMYLPLFNMGDMIELGF